MHIRRGDYVANPKIAAYHGVCGMNYYQKAVQIIKEKITNPTFFIFSDDINWAKENFKGDEYYFVSNKEIKETEDLILMSLCKHNIIANSSFSWWGAWLNKNHEKTVIAPRHWLNIKKDIAGKVLPDSWIKI